MDDLLFGAVVDRLTAEPLDADAEALLLSACQGDESLDAALGGAEVARPTGPATDPEAAAEPAGAYLRSITAEGFRGVGTRATIQLQPGPGLTVVVGRNGSGKSSFAEALEVLLTGSTDRFERQAVFRNGWRNRHQSATTRVAADLHVAGVAGTTVLERTWAAGADFAASTPTAQLPGKPKGSLTSLDWTRALETHRPFLAHSELEAMFGRPSDLHDRLSIALGLEGLTNAAGRLADRRKSLDSITKSASHTRKVLLNDLASLDDERAIGAAAALRARAVDLDAVTRIVTGAVHVDDGLIARLRALAQLRVVDTAEASGLATELRAARARLEATAGTDADRCLHLADLLAAALTHQRQHTTGADCPVCGTTDVLGAAWTAQTQGEIDRLRVEGAAVRQARDAAAAALARARRLAHPVPPDVSGADPQGAALDLGSLHTTWMEWNAGLETTDLVGLANHIEATALAFSEAVSAIAALAQEELARREDRWGPLAERIAAWVEVARRAEPAAASVTSLKKAEAWLRAAHDHVRNERLRPIAEGAQAIWTELRHESNVDLTSIRLTGSATRRQVDLAVDVDGTPSDALGVMSQGEVNALALSIFLPRATMPESPFRFVVVDDPVQAMDPAKVDGLARVLDRVAQSRQVVVFSHDDRLPSAIRRLDVAARILQVHRRARSEVEITAAGDPATQALGNARAIASDASVPTGVAERVVPATCRVALEAALTSIAQRKLLAAGKGHSEVEDVLAGATRLTTKAALGLFGDATRGADVLPRIRQAGRTHADTYQALNRGAHGELAGNPKDTVNATERLLEAITGISR